MPDQNHRVVIIGGGFGGVYAIRALRRAHVDITLIDKRNHHLFQPLLYQVATGGLSPANVAMPLRFMFRKDRHVRVVLGEVVDINAEYRRVELNDGDTHEYDSLIVATGSTHHYFGNDWEHRAPGLKSIEDALEIRKRVLLAFEEAERCKDPEKLAEWLTFVVVGAGPTGIEMAGTLAEIARHTLRNEFRHINTASARVILAEGLHRVLPPFPPELSRAAERMVRDLGVEVRTNTFVTEIDDTRVAFKCGDELEHVPSRTVVWAAGVKASPLGKVLAEATQTETDKGGRVIVNADCTVPNHPEIFVIGDLACLEDEDGEPLPGVAQVALQQGRYAARVISARLDRAPAPENFRYLDKGTLATIGRAAAVADIRGRHFAGPFAWFIWLFVHILFLIGFENRLLVLTQWAWNYLTWNRSARLITRHKDAP